MQHGEVPIRSFGFEFIGVMSLRSLVCHSKGRNLLGGTPPVRLNATGRHGRKAFKLQLTRASLWIDEIFGEEYFHSTLYGVVRRLVRARAPRSSNGALLPDGCAATEEPLLLKPPAGYEEGI